MAIVDVARFFYQFRNPPNQTKYDYGNNIPHKKIDHTEMKPLFSKMKWNEIKWGHCFEKCINDDHTQLLEC